MCSRSANWLSRSRVYPRLPRRSSPCLPEREPASLSLELKQERSTAVFRQAIKWLVISVSFHKCRVPFLDWKFHDALTMSNCHGNWRYVSLYVLMAHDGHAPIWIEFSLSQAPLKHQDRLALTLVNLILLLYLDHRWDYKLLEK